MFDKKRFRIEKLVVGEQSGEESKKILSRGFLICSWESLPVIPGPFKEEEELVRAREEGFRGED